MHYFSKEFTRRRFLIGLSTGALSLTGMRAFSEEIARFVESGDYADVLQGGKLVATPNQTEGPFFPDKLPLDIDNDLVVIGKRTTPAMGEVTNLTGKILDLNGNPLKAAKIEIWQVDVNGAYIHSGSDNAERRDANFQGYGRFETGSKGEYRFRTIKPVAYPGRTPHIHVKVTKGDRELLTTQCYVKGDSRNERDGIIRSIRDPRARESVIVPFEKAQNSKLGELSAVFDIVIGLTPEDLH